MARLKTINKFIKSRVPNESFSKDKSSYYNQNKSVNFYVNGQFQTTHFFTTMGFDLFFKDILELNFDIFMKKILLFKSTLDKNISKYPFENPFEQSINPTSLEIHYFNESEIYINKPDMFVFDYGSYAFYFNTKKNGSCLYKEKNSKTRYVKSEFIFDKNYDSKKILFKFLKHKLEQEVSFITEPINESNIEDYISLLKITSYK